MRRAKATAPKKQYVKESITAEFLRTVAQRSAADRWPGAAQEFLKQHGIALVIEPQLSQTYLDGAAIRTTEGHLIIGLTRRFDRIDNFWFTLLHELVHIEGNVPDEGKVYDDLEVNAQGDALEHETDAVAAEALIPLPTEEWQLTGARVAKTKAAVERLASKLQIHPAIIAGRIRHEERNYRLLPQLSGQDEVRRCFLDVNW
ncbi:MAG: hypothetical protein NVS2B7_04750 [Herpetosiphon sp.]